MNFALIGCKNPSINWKYTVNLLNLQFLHHIPRELVHGATFSSSKWACFYDCTKVFQPYWIPNADIHKAHAHVRAGNSLRTDIWGWDCAESKHTRLLPARLGILSRRAGFFLTRLGFAFRGVPQQSSRSDCAVLYGWYDRRKRRITDNRHAGGCWEVTFASLSHNTQPSEKICWNQQNILM